MGGDMNIAFKKHKIGNWRTIIPCLIMVPLFLMVFQPVANGGQSLPTDEIFKYSMQWSQSSHSHNAIANGTNNDAIKNAEDAQCLICHDTYGFITWSKKGFDTGFGTPKIQEAGGASGPGCIACHNTDAKGSCGSMLRLEDNTPMTLGGFMVENAGSGAICIVCHNGRRGLYNDSDKPIMNHRAPHEASSADMLLGVNYFFVPVGEIQPHFLIKDTCVACHMDPWARGGEHTFKASWDGCRSCHSDVDGEKYRKAGEEGREKLNTAIAQTVSKVIQGAIDAGSCEMKITYEDESEDENFTQFKSGKVESVKNRYFHGAQSYDITISGKTSLITIKNIKIDGHKLLDTVQGQTIAKAGWNLYSFDHDRSHGAHNPPFQAAVVEASINNLKKVDLNKITPLKK